MNVNGKLHEITNMSLFISSYTANPAHPNPASFKPMADAQIFLGTDFPAGFTNSFIPGFSFQTKTDANGAFTIIAPDGFPKTVKAFLLATHTIMKVLPPFNIPIFAPVYRSETFQFSQINSKTQDIFVVRSDGTAQQGFSQAQINSMTTGIQQKMNLDSLSAFINDGSVGIVGNDQGATLKADLFLSPFTGLDLNTFISEKVDNIDIDLPGPDFIVGLLVTLLFKEAHHLSCDFHFRTCVSPKLKAVAMSLSFIAPPVSNHICNALSRSGLRSLGTTYHHLQKRRTC
jgi:hypothetical protein